MDVVGAGRRAWKEWVRVGGRRRRPRTFGGRLPSSNGYECCCCCCCYSDRLNRRESYGFEDEDASQSCTIHRFREAIVVDIDLLLWEPVKSIRFLRRIIKPF